MTNQQPGIDWKQLLLSVKTPAMCNKLVKKNYELVITIKTLHIDARDAKYL